MASTNDPFQFHGKYPPLLLSLPVLHLLVEETAQFTHINYPHFWINVSNWSLLWHLEFEEAGNLLEANRDATTISIEDDEIKPEKQRQAAAFSPAGEDEDPLASDDKTEVCIRIALPSAVQRCWITYLSDTFLFSLVFFFNLSFSLAKRKVSPSGHLSTIKDFLTSRPIT